MHHGRDSLEEIYQQLPKPLQNLALSAFGMHVRATRYNRTFRQLFQEVCARDDWTAEQTEAFRDARIRSFVQHCGETVPYYRDLFRREKIDPRGVRTFADLTALPILDRETVYEQPEAFVSDAVPPRRRLKKFTSGTTGAGLQYLTTMQAHREQWAVWWRHRQRHGIMRGTPCAMFRSLMLMLVPLDQESPPFWRYNRPAREIYFSASHLNDRSLPHYIEELNRRRPPWLHGYPSSVTTLAGLMVDRGRTLDYPVRWVTLGSEQLYPHQIALIEQAFGVTPIQHYGMVEGAAGASQEPDGEWHVDEDFAALEIVACPGSAQNEIVGTNFSNPAFPLLRYRVGDLAALSGRQDTRGRRILARLEGRNDDYILRPDGTRLGRLDFVFRRMANIREAQLHQNQIGAVVIKVVKGRGYSQRDEAALLDAARKYIGADTAISVVYVAAIERSPSGKLRQVLSELPEARIRSGRNET